MTKRGKFALAGLADRSSSTRSARDHLDPGKLLRVLRSANSSRSARNGTSEVDGARASPPPNRDLKQMVSDGKFLEGPLLPPRMSSRSNSRARDRREDIAVLIDHFVDKH
jgi:transcriptional regulator with GAF, ATPase, and Fis domain